ncbi:hypothetical protein [Frondihabitans cladoniiphilus]|uniref:Ribosomally synthesized peptide with SipW-like signal peptide n=1 Tax=Frondihabitans cladoniiphilus TaxID=715785 RepID=A0ABP8VW60_9MICO
MPPKIRLAPLRERFAPLPLVVSVVAVAGLALSGSGTFAGFTASVTNGTDSAGAGTLVMQESSAGHTCTSVQGTTVSLDSSTCSAVNKLGGDLAMPPGRTVVTTISIANIGSVAAGTFALEPEGPCTQAATAAGDPGSATDLCARILVTIRSGSTTVFEGSAQALGTAKASDLRMPAAPSVGEALPFTFSATLDPTAGNGYQGLGASLPLRWSFTS